MKFIIISLTLLIFIEDIKNAMLRLKFRRKSGSVLDEVPKIPTMDELDSLSKVSLEAWISIRSPSFTPQRYTNFEVEGKGERVLELIDEKDIDPSVQPPVMFEGFRKNIMFGQEGSSVPALDKFYFRLSGNNIYYTKDEKDLVVLGAINVKNVVNVGNNTRAGPNCFKVMDGEKDQWELCTESPEVQQEWFCALKKILGETCDAPPEVKVVKELNEEVILYQLPSPQCNENWNYMHLGKDWECQCKEGRKQSPIDINPNMTCNPYQVAPFTKFEFKPMKNDNWRLNYEDNLVRIQCFNSPCESFGSIQMVGMDTFEGQSIEFHTPSDHMIGGKRYDLEIQAIYQNSNPKGQRAVISFLFLSEPGHTNEFMNSLDLTRIPNVVQLDKTFLAKGTVAVQLSDMWNSPEDGLKYQNDFSYFYYEGSLTSPQCEEDTHWFIVSEPFMLGNAYITMLKQALTDLPDLTEDSVPDSTYVNRNSEGVYRELQPLNGRQVSFHQSCAPPEKKEDGHYESVETTAEYWYYNGQKKAVGLEGAEVVPYEEMGKILRGNDKDKEDKEDKEDKQ